MAEKKKDEKLLKRIRGADLFACEAKFRKNCSNNYMQKPQKWQSIDEQACNKQSNLMEAHNKAFQEVCQEVQKDENKMVKFADLTQVYILYLHTNLISK